MAFKKGSWEYAFRKIRTKAKIIKLSNIFFEIVNAREFEEVDIEELKNEEENIKREFEEDNEVDLENKEKRKRFKYLVKLCISYYKYNTPILFQANLRMIGIEFGSGTARFVEIVAKQQGLFGLKWLLKEERF